jgi:D-alanine-D-alanine ligase
MIQNSVIIFHSPLAADAPADELDVLQQAEFFKSGLTELGFDVEIFSFPYDLSELEIILRERKPVWVVNLVETLFADGRLVHIGPFMFDHFKIPYTGCSAHSIYLSSHKILSKQHMQVHGIKTPAFFTYQSLCDAGDDTFTGRYLVKSLWEHASFGLDEDKKLLFSSRKELLERMQTEARPNDFFCEEYIHGREFNLSVLDGADGPEVLPPAEIRFEYPADKPRILGYKAKWEEESFEYKHTVRSFEFPMEDSGLLLNLKTIALTCWNVFELSGYARVDFRVDENGDVYVLEINANPCISPDSGFVAAAQQAGLRDKEVVSRIVDGIKR